ncbi:hypothetical protein ACFSE0_11165 [Ochrobactrum teleogrylli]|uniref:Uncharacterized protein n=1 Tax=Ochrobactrum teleogrylli TaxID=2479765 RepID=A0ABY2Y0H6_9HYPH|nr:hypothetical protein [[Ochrobactrum] teleogrylli]TNV09311.1 hypothetical protein FIC94_22110 [[Ochrobactrum] teleogrylli]
MVNGTVSLAFCNNDIQRNAQSSKDVGDDYIGTCQYPLKVATDTYVEVSKDTYWEYWKQGTCKGDYRDYTARLMNIQGSWEDTCQIAPVNVDGVPFIEGRKCENSFDLGTLIHGEYATFRVRDESCSNKNISQAHFASNELIETGTDKGCNPSGQSRRYEARLWDITGSWEDACNAMPFIIKGKYFPKPSACFNHGGIAGEFGYFDVHDATCPK